MTDNSASNKRIAKNTLLLYLRMMFIMCVTLYTSRIILKTLGVEDYGVYNVTGGVIAMFSFINNAMVSATQRYITFALGKGDENNLIKIFSSSIQIHALISFLIIIIGETIGLWFVLNELVIPEGRMSAAIIVYQCSIVASVVNIMSVPYNAAIIAHEKMSAFAYISILQVVLNLLIVYILLLTPIDKLVLYAILYLCIQITIRYVYSLYCHRHFAETKYRHVIDKTMLKEMTGFAGWNFFGNIAHVLYTQGLNILLNTFFGPIVNAARGISVQVLSALGSFTSSFQVAVNPQITKSFANGDYQRMHDLMYKSARFSFFLLVLLAIPLFLEIDFVLKIWLTEVPDNTPIFVRIMLLNTLLGPFMNPCSIASQASGQIRKFQSYVGSTLLLIVPISYIVLKLGAPAYSVFVVHFFVECIAQTERMILLRNLVSLSIRKYIINTYMPCFIVLLIGIILPLYIHNLLIEGWNRLVCVSIINCLSYFFVVYLLGLKKDERDSINKKIIKIFHNA